MCGSSGFSLQRISLSRETYLGHNRQIVQTRKLRVRQTGAGGKFDYERRRRVEVVLDFEMKEAGSSAGQRGFGGAILSGTSNVLFETSDA